MPLLGKKLFVCAKPLKDIKPDEDIYTITHSKEQFRSKKEFDKRNSWYSERIWTCRCTGHTNLTHQEAWNSEKIVYKSIKQQFPKCHEKAVLELVHHSSLSLDTLVDQAWLVLQQVLSLGEPVALKVKAAGKLIKGHVVKLNKAGVEANPTSNCNSPSSDKENSVEDSNGSPKKWMPPKLLSYKYSLRLEDEDKVINEIPAVDISRLEKPPSKELLRLFIRANTLRVGQNQTSPWVVDDDKVKEYSLPSKYAPCLLSPVKVYMAEMTEKEEPLTKKRKLSLTNGPVAKKAKIDKINSAKKSKDTDKKKQSKLTGSPLKKSSSTSKLKSTDKLSKKSPKKIKSPEFIEIISDCSSDDENCPLSKIQNDMENHPLSKLTSPSKPKSTTKSPAKEKKSSPKKKAKVLSKDKKSSKKDKKSSPKKKVNDKKISPRKRQKDLDSDEDQPLAKLKMMKQMTLFEMSKKKGMKTPEKLKSTTSSSRTPEKGLKTPERKKILSPPKTPALVTKIIKAHSQEDKAKFKLLVQQAAKVLTTSQRRFLPPEIKDIVMKQIELIAERKKLKSMKPAQREAYMKEKREKNRQKQREKLKELKKKFEDQDLTHKPLPAPKLVPTPDGIPNEVFGDVALITEFISCYSGLLMPEENYPILTDALMKAMSCGKDGFAYLSRALTVLLQTLLQDEISEDYQEIKVQLSDIPVNPYTASELTRLCLRRQDEGAEDNHEEEVEDEVSDDLVQLLESQELYQLDPVQKVQIIKGLCLRIMGTYSVQDYMEEKQTESSKLWRKKLAELKVRNDKLKKEKEKKKSEKKAEQAQKEEKMKNTDSSNQKEDKDSSLLISHFYGKAGAEQNGSSKPGTPEPTSADSTEESDDLVSVLKRRRLNAARAAAEKEQRVYETRKKKEKEYEEYRKQREQENFEKAFNEGIALAKAVLRQTPIGTDRNHSRYWIFYGVTPGLYIEKGWVNEDINYNVQASGSNSSDSEDSDAVSDNAEHSRDEEPEHNVERTVPHFGQNLWFMYDTVKDLDNLIESLHPQGFRESKLKAELKKRYAEITKGITAAQRSNSELRDSDGDKDMLDSLRKELLDTETKLRYGGLGGVNDFDLWETKLQSTTDTDGFGKLMIETQENVMEKFRQGIMVPKKKKPKVTEITDEKENEDDVKEEEEEEKEVPGIVNWREAVENAMTLSRLHVLLGILDTSIKWEKSAENAKCKICRKKGDDMTLLLCDECNQAFHMYCLRPALMEVPKGDWFCAACMPQDQRRKSRAYSSIDSSDEEGDDGEMEHEENCAECGGDEGLIFCAECPAAFHLECHDPPLRHPPRGRWVCTECKTGVKRRTRSRATRNTAKKSGRAPPKRKRYVESSEEEEEDDGEEEEEEEESEEEEEEEVEAPKKNARNTQEKSRRGRKPGSPNKPRTSTSSNTSLNDSRTFTSRRAPSQLSICEQIINDVMKMEASWPFLAPVNKKDVPDYHKIIKHPMDLQLVKDKLTCLVYGSVEEVFEDVKQIFINAEVYNKVGSEILDCKDEVETNFASLVKKNLPMCLYTRVKNLHLKEAEKAVDQHSR